MVATLGCTGGYDSIEMYRSLRGAAAKVSAEKKGLAWEEFGEVMEKRSSVEHVRGSVDFC